MDASRPGQAVIRVCFHGAESTGKSTLAGRFSEEFDCPWVAEYGRAYCEERGVNLTMADLRAMAEGQDAAMRVASAGRPDLLILDTDPLMTAAWAEMLFGEVPPELLGYAKADHYLLFTPDVPWRPDGTRLFGTPGQRERFAAVSEAILERAGVPYTRIAGDWETREIAARAALTAFRA